MIILDNSETKVLFLLTFGASRYKNGTYLLIIQDEDGAQFTLADAFGACRSPSLAAATSPRFFVLS